MVRDRSEAEGVVQSTFRLVKEKLPDYRGTGSLRAWILTIGRRQALDEMRRRRRLSREVPIAVVQPAVSSEEESLITRVDLTRALASLTGDERRTLLLTAAGYTSDEMADVLGVAATTIRSRRATAREKLLRLLDGYSRRER
jgi:RNA polymerase sigma-70 factor (ECF subfamily)